MINPNNIWSYIAFVEHAAYRSHYIIDPFLLAMLTAYKLRQTAGVFNIQL